MHDSETRKARALDVLRTFVGSDDGAREMAEYLESRGALGSIALQVGFGEIWGRDELSRRDRSLVAITMLGATASEQELRSHISYGLNHGLTREEIDEIFVQLGAYAGLPVALAGARIADEVFAERDGAERRETPAAPLEDKTPEQRRLDGFGVIKTLAGQTESSTKVAGQLASSTHDTFEEFVVDYAMGDVWSRPQLSRRDRSLVVISTLSALNTANDQKIADHVHGALNQGVTRTEVEEIMLTAVIYCGFPKAIDGLMAARRVFEKQELQSDCGSPTSRILDLRLAGARRQRYPRNLAA